jgi:hypothetical protein
MVLPAVPQNPLARTLPARSNTPVSATTSDTADTARPHECLAHGRHQPGQPDRPGGHSPPSIRIRNCRPGNGDRNSRILRLFFL